jgi:hypothetical protein
MTRPTEGVEVPSLISSIAQALAGAQGVPRGGASPVNRTKDTKAGKPVRDNDEVIVGAEAIESSQAVRGMTSNEQEDAREDHQQHGTGEYGPRGTNSPQPGRRLDLNG